MQTRALETLTRIAQVRSFGRAAELQNMTLPALSMQMKALEFELNAALFDRSHRPPRLTPLGRAVADAAQRVLAEQARLVDLCGPGDALTGRFAIGFIQSASVRILPGFLARARQSEPQASFRLTSGLSETLTEQVALGQIDAAVITRVMGDAPGLRFDTLATEPMAVAVPSAFEGMALGDLAESLPFVHFMPHSGIGKLIAGLLENLPQKPAQTLVLDSIEASMECVKAGLGYTILPLPDIERYRDPTVVLLAQGPGPMYRELALVTPRTAAADKWHVALLGLLENAIATASPPASDQTGAIIPTIS